LALPPDTQNEAFLREVDENLRRDQMEGFARRYGTWLVAALVLFLAAVGGYLYWQNQQEKEAAERSEQLTAVYNDIAAGKFEEAQKELRPLQESGNDTVRSLALLTDSAVALETSDRQTALAKYKILASDESAPDAYRNLALVRSTALEFDTLKPEQVVARLEPLTKPGNPWFGSAGELTAMAYLKQGQKEKAGRLFASIAADKNVPPTMRSRAVQIAGTLGVDASASMPEATQPGMME